MNFSKLFLHWLQGSSWSFTREITDYMHPDASGTVEGTATFVPRGEEQLVCQETGILTTARQTFRVQRCMLYGYDPNHKSVTLHDARNPLDTGKLFDLYFAQDEQASLCASSSMLCANDEYAVEFKMQNTDGAMELQVTYDVRGPHKAYTSTTTFRPRRAGP